MSLRVKRERKTGRAYVVLGEISQANYQYVHFEPRELLLAHRIVFILLQRSKSPPNNNSKRRVTGVCSDSDESTRRNEHTYFGAPGSGSK